jgi:hypothetical protein
LKRPPFNGPLTISETTPGDVNTASVATRVEMQELNEHTMVKLATERKLTDIIKTVAYASATCGMGGEMSGPLLNSQDERWGKY